MNKKQSLTSVEGVQNGKKFTFEIVIITVPKQKKEFLPFAGYAPFWILSCEKTDLVAEALIFVSVCEQVLERYFT